MKSKILPIIIIAILALVIFAGPALAQSTQRFGRIIAKSLVVINQATFQSGISADGGLDLNGQILTLDADADTTIKADTNDQIDFEAGGSDVANITALGLSISNVLNLADTDSVVVGAQTITPTYSYLQVSPPTLLTITLATGSAAEGDILIVQNMVATNTNIVDTGATVGGGAIDLGANDLAGFIFGNGAWVEMFSPDNS